MEGSLYKWMIVNIMNFDGFEKNKCGDFIGEKCVVAFFVFAVILLLSRPIFGVGAVSFSGFEAVSFLVGEGFS